MSEPTPSGFQRWGLSIPWLLLAGAVLVMTAVITTIALRLLEPQPSIPTPTISPSPAVVIGEPSTQRPFIIIPTDGVASATDSPTAVGPDAVPARWISHR